MLILISSNDKITRDIPRYGSERFSYFFGSKRNTGISRKVQEGLVISPGVKGTETSLDKVQLGFVTSPGVKKQKYLKVWFRKV